MSDLKTVTFKEIDAGEFSAFAKWSVKNYAENLIKSGEEKIKIKARKSAKAEFKDIFPDGANTRDNYLYIVQNEAKEKIGVIGYQKSPFEENAAFVIENVIKQEYRGQGYGKAALIKLQEDAMQKGYAKMVLNAFKHAAVSINMYKKNGFDIVEDYGGSVIMEKILINSR